MIDGKASYAVHSQLRNLDSSRLINKAGAIDTALIQYEKPLARRTLASGFFIPPADRGGSPKAICPTFDPPA